jgi:hypothetical protein
VQNETGEIGDGYFVSLNYDLYQSHSTTRTIIPGYFVFVTWVLQGNRRVYDFMTLMQLLMSNQTLDSDPEYFFPISTICMVQN